MVSKYDLPVHTSYFVFHISNFPFGGNERVLLQKWDHRKLQIIACPNARPTEISK